MTASSGMRRDCPGGCGGTAAAGKLMCPGDWQTLPKVLQDAVNGTWKQWRNDLRDPAKLRAYREASDEAEDFVRAFYRRPPARRSGL